LLRLASIVCSSPVSHRRVRVRVLMRAHVLCCVCQMAHALLSPREKPSFSCSLQVGGIANSSSALRIVSLMRWRWSFGLSTNFLFLSLFTSFSYFQKARRKWRKHTWRHTSFSRSQSNGKACGHSCGLVLNKRAILRTFLGFR